MIARRRKPRRVSVVRNRKYLDYLKLCECEACKVIGEFRSRQVDPAHGPVNGFGSKGGDDGAISLCRTHHREQHALTWPVFEKKYGIDRAMIAALGYSAFRGLRT